MILKDITLKSTDAEIAEIERKALDSLVFGCRLDVDSLESDDGKFYNGGFDYFVLNKNIEYIYRFSRTKMCIGQPWWDFWMPLMCIRKGLRPIKNQSKIAYHILHSQEWDIDQLFEYGQLVAQDIGMIAPLTRNELQSFTETVWKTIEEHHEKFKFNGTSR